MHALYFVDRMSSATTISAGRSSAPKAAGNPVGYFTPRATSTTSSTGKRTATSTCSGGPGARPPATRTDTGSPGRSAHRATRRRSSTPREASIIVFYRATDGHIHDVYWSTGPAGHENLSGFARAPRRREIRFAFYTPHDDMRQVIYRGIDGHIHEL